MNPARTKYPALAITFLAALVLVNFTVAAHAADVRMPDTGKILAGYGFKGGVFDRGNEKIYEIDDNVWDKIGEFEDDTIIDTAEEFITAAYFSPIKISYNAQKVVDAELPHNTEGALRLTAMWKKKQATHPENATAYQNVIAIIKEKANLTDDQIREYYNASIEKEVMKLGKKHLGKYYSDDELKNTVLKPIIDYMCAPTPEGLKNIKAMQKKVYESRKEVVLSKYCELISEIDPSLSDNVLTASL